MITHLADLIEFPVPVVHPTRPDGGQPPSARVEGVHSSVGCPLLAVSPGTARPGELPAPATMSVPAADLAAGDRVIVSGRTLAVDTILRRAGTLRLHLSDGSTHTAGPDEPWRVCRG